MARPRKKGLSYYPKDVDFYDDMKIMTLLDEYGPLGVTIYEVLLTMIYRGDGYYLAAPLDLLATQIVRKIGSRWVPKKDLVLQVIHRCVDIGLFHEDLLTKGVITSAGIQKRYAEVTVRNKVDKSKYWLLDEDDVQTAGNCTPSFGINAAETRVFEAETAVSATEMQQSKEKQIKEKQSKLKQSKAEAPEVPEAAACCAAHREFKKIKRMTPNEAQRILELNETYGEGSVLSAIRTAIERGGRSLAYVERILEDRKTAAPAGKHEPTYDADDIESIMYDEWFGDEL